MSADKQYKIVLETIKTARGVIRLSHSRVALLDDQPSVVSKPGDLPSRCNPVPLLIFLALWKLRFVQKKQEPFQARGADHKWATQLYDLIKNCGKKQTCWLEKVFGSHKDTPNVCTVHRVVKAFKDGRDHVVAPASCAPDPDQIKLTFNGKLVDGESDMQDFLRCLGFTDVTGASPKRENGKRLSAASLSLIDANASGGQHSLLDEFGGELSLQFPKCSVAQYDFEQECRKRLKEAPHKLNIKWFGMGMEYGGPWLPDVLPTLVSSFPECQITVEIAMLDPDWECLGYLNPDWPKKARTSHDTLTALADSYRVESRKSKRKISIAIGTYQYMPNWHGFALDNSRVYLTTCSWRENPPESGKRHLVGGENPYFVVHIEHGGIESWLAGVFNGWFDYAFNWSSRRSRRNQAVRRKQR